MKKRACKTSLIRISAFLDHELSFAQRQKLEAHLASCPDCRGYLEETRRVFRLVKSLPALEPSREAMLELKARLLLVADGRKENVCERMPIRLSSFLDDELTAFDREQVESHLGGCADCTRYLNELRAVRGHLRLLPQLEPRPEVIAELMARIRSSEVSVQKRLAPVFSFPRLATARFALAAAAVAVLFFVVLLFKFSPFGPGADLAMKAVEAPKAVGAPGSSPVAVQGSRDIDLADLDLNKGKDRLLAESVSEESKDSDYLTEERSGGTLKPFDPNRRDTRGRVVHSVSFGDSSARRAPVSSRVLFVSYGN